MIKEYSPHEESKEPGEPDSSELQHLVKIRRQHLSQTIDELGHELSPSRLIERGLDETTDFALEKLSHKTSELVETATKEVKRNPWPILLAGAGLLIWLSRDKSESKT